MENVAREYPFRSVLSLKPLIDYLEKNNIVPEGRKHCLRDDFLELLAQTPELSQPITDMAVLEKNKEMVERLMSLVFAVANWEIDAVAAVVPYYITPVVASPQFTRLFLDENGSFHGRVNINERHVSHWRVIRAYLLILEKVYNVHINFNYPFVRIVPDPDTGLDRHFKVNVDFRFVEINPVGELRKLTESDIDFILEHITDPEEIRKLLPPEAFELRGFTVLQAVDVTETEVLSALERDLIDQQSIISRVGFTRLQQRLRTLFGRPKLMAGLAAVQDDQVLLVNRGCVNEQNCIFAESKHLSLASMKGTIFDRVLTSEEVMLVPDVQKDFGGFGEDNVMPEEAKSLMIAPLRYRERVIGILMLACPHPRDLGPMHKLLMTQLQPLFSMAMKRVLDDLESRMQAIIKEKCTALHPTVEWRFRKAALHHLESIRTGKPSEFESIVFKDVYPLYGISDVRGSTKARNMAIQEDLAEHLDLGLKVIRSATESESLPIFLELAARIEQQLKRLDLGLGSGDEQDVIRFLRDELESTFPHLKRYGPKVIRSISAYEDALDPHLGTVYRRRMEFEQSVSVLSNRLAAFLDQEEAKAQGLSPHYFERHRTDGVDYVIYMGASLLEDGVFNELYLKNMRLWQLKVACGMAFLEEQLRSSLSVPLETAHLIFVQDKPLSIRFRFDEKRFDVDGTYDIRHAIIKSRLDKAVVKGTEERLTQPGRIAVVYSHSEEAKEMLRHIEFLQAEGWLNDDLESLEIEDLPGVKGLKAVRVGVNLKAQEMEMILEEERQAAV